MMYIEVQTSRGALTADQRRQVGEGITAALTGDGAESAPEEVLDRARSLEHVVFHEQDDWFAGGRRLGGGESRFLVRMSVPEGWIAEGIATPLIEACTKTLATVVGDRVYEQPDALVHVIGVPDGGIGINGKAMTSNDLVRYLTAPNRGAAMPTDLPPEMGYDPVCGMTVPFKHAAGTAEHEGVRYAFCSKGCHDVFVEDHAA